MDSAEQWRITLAQIKVRMARQTFEFLLYGSRPLERTPANGAGSALWRVAVRNPPAVPWLEKLWQAQVDELASGIAGEPVRVAFEAAASPFPERSESPVPSPAEPHAMPSLALDPPRTLDSGLRPAGNRSPAARWPGEFDVEAGGWLKLPLYAITFWWELIGPLAAAIWLVVRSTDTRRQPAGPDPLGRWTPPIRINLDQLAHQLAGGNRLTVAGVWRICQRFSPDDPGACQDCPQRDAAGVVGPVDGPCRFRLPGALEVLEAEGLARLDRGGSARNDTYQVSVIRSFPLLSPQQAGRLHPATQARHEHWLLRNGVDVDAWRGS
jgi:hypothetical protein